MRQSLVQFARGIVNRFLFWVPGVVLALSDLYEQHIRMQLPDWARPEVKIDPSVGLWLIALGVLWASFLTYHELHQTGDAVRGRLALDGGSVGVVGLTGATTYQLGIRLSFANLSNDPIDCELLPSLVGVGADRFDWIDPDPTATFPPNRIRHFEGQFTVPASEFSTVSVAYGLLYGTSGRPVSFRREGVVRLSAPPVQIQDGPIRAIPYRQTTLEEPRPVDMKLERRTRPWRPVLDTPKAPTQ